MITDNYVNNIFNRSITDLETNGEFYILTTILPNGYTLSVSRTSPESCVSWTKQKIKELEGYLERDKVFYGYDLAEEFVDESMNDYYDDLAREFLDGEEN